jgi:iron complex outermembrane receptor protein
VDVRAVSAGFNQPFEARLFGSEAFDAENMIAYEMGGRLQSGRRLALDLALFYNGYDDVRTLSLESVADAEPRPIATFVVANDAKGRTYGAEASATLQIASWWRWRATYAYLQMRVAPEDDAPAATLIEALPGDNPMHQASLWSSVDLVPSVELDVRGRYVDALRGRNIPSYTTADVRVGWRVTPRFDVAVIGQDLLEDRHAEFATIAFIADNRQIARRAFARMSWRF